MTPIRNNKVILLCKIQAANIFMTASIDAISVRIGEYQFSDIDRTYEGKY